MLMNTILIYARYFLWLGDYTSWLISAAIVGGFCYIVDSFQTGKPVMAPLFAVFMVGWNTLFLENWKRKQVQYSLEWGMTDFETEQQELMRCWRKQI